MSALIQVACARAGHTPLPPKEGDASASGGATGVSLDDAASTGGDAVAASPSAGGSRNLAVASCDGLVPCRRKADCHSGESCLRFPSCGNQRYLCATWEHACAIGCGAGAPCAIGKSKPPVVLCDPASKP